MKERIAQHILTPEEKAAVDKVLTFPLATLNAQAAAMALLIGAQWGMSPGAHFNSDFTAVEEPKAKE